jgi:hypothetical protein
VRRSLAVLALAALTLATSLSVRPGSTEAQAADTSVYAGLGTWISIYGTKAFTQPDTVAAAIAARGVKTVYVETSNYSQATDVVRPQQLGALVDALHARGLHVVAWYLPGLARPALDLRRTLAAVQFTTPTGGRFDGFALDIEATAVKRPALRTKRALALSEQLRSAVGPSYPLGAIIPSPRGLVIKPAYWPGFPYSQLAGIYDVFLPMVYWTYSTRGPDGACPSTLSAGRPTRRASTRSRRLRSSSRTTRTSWGGASTTGSGRNRRHGRRSPASRRRAADL